MAYKGIVWPLRLNSRGDFDSGDQRRIIKSDIRTVLQTRRFVNLNFGGERKMRPGAYAVMPFQLMKPFDPVLIEALTNNYAREALSFLEEQGKIQVQRILTTLLEGKFGLRGIALRIFYMVLVDQLQDDYTFEIETQLPTNSDGIRRT